ncbi:acyltransferase [Luteitalea sp. TBR-22]|uniref:acyltransferase family protein n=1 Tax=Luteitalea sp. TBR-22 TaxID=2802971 RepID=UPI001AFC8C73|nr:acyltransferase [Luteitalea sp. TBR-22]BCS34984.1 acyltransferase [Luteitalea sp. TBR-22]
MPSLRVRHRLHGIFVRREGRFEQIDGLRAIAILWVFASHVLFLLSEFLQPSAIAELVSRPGLQWMWHGHFGVDIFFVISGFLIGNLLITEVERTRALDLRRFYVRRLLRLFPVYLVVIAFVAVFGLLTGDPKVPLRYVWTNLLYVNNFVTVFSQFMSWTWSLAIEEQFYLLCPLFVLALSRTTRSPLAVVCWCVLAGYVLNLVIGHVWAAPIHYVIHPALNPPEFARYFDLLYDKLHTRYACLLMGVGVAYLLRHERALAWLGKPVHGHATLVLALLLLVGTPLWIDHGSWDRPSGTAFMSTYRYTFSLGVALLLALTFTPHAVGRWLVRALSARPWYPIAQVSYSTYLIHPVVLFMVIRAQYGGGSVTALDILRYGITGAIVTFAIASALFVFIEKPLLDRRPG